MTFPKKDISNMISQEMNLKEQIHHHLFSDIVNGVYTPGSILHEKKPDGKIRRQPRPYP